MADVAVEAAPGDENDDSWLYGESTGEVNEENTEGKVPKELEKTRASSATGDAEEKDQEDGEEENNDDSQFNDEHFADVGREDQNGDADSQDNGDSDSDDSDDVKVTIGDIKSGPQYASLNIKRGVGLVASGAAEKPRTTTTGGKVTLDDFDGMGSINGVPALEFNIDTIEDKPWNKPGADISDYFNYGFNEVTWSAYCDRQRRMRVNETGIGMHPVNVPRVPPPDIRRPPVRGPDESMPPPTNNFQARENTIQVMTAERREYGRLNHPRDMPPSNEYFAPPPTDYYPPAHPPYEESWGHQEQTGWTPTDIKELTPGPMGPPPMGPPVNMSVPMASAHIPSPHVMPPSPYGSSYRPHHHERDRDRDRDRDRETRIRERDDRERRDRDRRDDEDRERDRDRSRSIKPERVREKSYRRERSRSRSRRHKSRSRSPRQRDRSRERDRDRSRDRERSVKPKIKDKDKDEEK